MKKLIALLLLFICVPIFAANSNELTYKKLKTLLDHYRETYSSAHHFSGIMLSVYTPQLKHIMNVEIGTTEINGSKLIDNHNLIQLGGGGDLFRSLIILQLEATPQFHFSIEDKISRYLPQYPQWSEVTIKQLLNMTSGIPDVDETFFRDYYNHPYQHRNAQDLIQYVVNKPLLFSPGHGWGFSRSNYVLLDMIIETVTKHTIKREITNRFFDPAFEGLSNSFFIEDHFPHSLATRVIHGYSAALTTFVPEGTDVTNYSMSFNNGGILTNTQDLVKWQRSIFSSHSILSEKQYKEFVSLVSMKTGKPLSAPTANEDGFGLGFEAAYNSFESTENNHIMYSYGGTPAGYHIIYTSIPSRQFYIAIAINAHHEQNQEDLEALLKNIYAVLCN